MQRLFCYTEGVMWDSEKPVKMEGFKCPGCGSTAVEDVTPIVAMEDNTLPPWQGDHEPEQVATDEKKKENVQ